MTTQPLTGKWKTTKDCLSCIHDRAYCSACKRQFSTTGRLHRHMRRLHRGTPRTRLCVYP